MQKVGIDVERNIRLQAHFWRDPAALSTTTSSSAKRPRLAAVITHPHPAFGGDMRNNVTVALFEALSKSGCFPGGVVKFNFRGVGGSTGSSTLTGKDEREDVLAVCRFLLSQDPALDGIVLVGYSFGSCVALSAAYEVIHNSADEQLKDKIVGCVAVSYPYGWISSVLLGSHYPKAVKLQLPKLFLIGDNDNFATATSLHSWATKPSSSSSSSSSSPATPHVKVETFKNIDHFWFGQEQLIVDSVLKWIDSLPLSTPPSPSS